MGRTMMMSQATAVGVEKIGEQYDEGGINNMKALQKASKFLSDYTSVVVIAIAVVTFFRTVYDGMGESGIIHGHGGK